MQGPIAVGVPFDVGVAMPSADIRAVVFTDGAGALLTSADDAVIGATGVRLGYLKYAEHAADGVFLGHVDQNSSTTVYQINCRNDGWLYLKGPGGSRGIVLIGGDSSGLIQMNVDATTIRMRMNTTGIGFFSATPVAQSTGWAAITNPVVRKTFDTTTVTLPQLAEFVGTLSEYVKSLGLIAV